MKTPTATRNQLAVAAAQLFYTEGITASGVDAIVRHAGVSKPTLYSHYRSKSELVAAALDLQHQAGRQMIEAYLNQRTEESPEEHLLAVFDWLEDWSGRQGTRGCAFLNAAAELVDPQDEPARQVIRSHKQWWQSLLAGLARDAGARDPVRLADELLLLIDGVSARVLVTGHARVAASARRVARLLLWESRSPNGRSDPEWPVEVPPGPRDDWGQSEV
jgi:AcrR family transcriptional regulator